MKWTEIITNIEGVIAALGSILTILWDVFYNVKNKFSSGNITIEELEYFKINKDDLDIASRVLAEQIEKNSVKKVVGVPLSKKEFISLLNLFEKLNIKNLFSIRLIYNYLIFDKDTPVIKIEGSDKFFAISVCVFTILTALYSVIICYYHEAIEYLLIKELLLLVIVYLLLRYCIMPYSFALKLKKKINSIDKCNSNSL